MRIRQVRPELWSDEKVGPLADNVTLFYIGLWNLSDDAGWLVWVPAQAGALLYPYKAKGKREREIVKWLAALEKAERVRIYACGCVEIPTLPAHQRVSGVQSTKVRDAHTQHPNVLLSDKQEPLTDPDKQSPLSDSPVEEGRGRERRGTVEGAESRATADDAADDLDEEAPVLQYLASVHAVVQPTGNGYHRDIVTLVGRRGAASVVEAMRRRHAAGDRSARQLIYGAANDLEPIHRGPNGPSAKGAAAQDLEAVEARFR